MTIWNKFVCPNCRHKLLKDYIECIDNETAIVCKGCGKRYPFYRNVIDFRLEWENDGHDKWSTNAFENIYEKFGDWNSLFDWDRIRGLPEKATLYRYDKLKRNIIEMIKPTSGEVILDLGCGNGYFLMEIIELFSSKVKDVTYIGLDVSRHNIINFQKKIVSKRFDNVHSYVCNAQILPFESNSVNLVTSLEVLEHIADKEVALREVYRILTPGGRLLFTTPSKNAIRNWNIILMPFRLGRRIMQLRLKRNKQENAPYDEPVSIDDYRDILNRIGFENIELHTAQMLNDEVIKYMPKLFHIAYIFITGLLENNILFLRKLFALHIIGSAQKRKI